MTKTGIYPKTRFRNEIFQKKKKMRSLQTSFYIYKKLKL